MRRTTIAAMTMALVALAAPAAHAGGGGGCLSPGGDAETTTVEIASGCFRPAITRVETGATVTWITQDSWPHTVTSGGIEWEEAQISSPESFEHTFARPGIYPYYCRLHVGMGGVVVVGDVEVPPAVLEDPGAATGASTASGIPGAAAAIGALILAVVAFGAGRKTA